MNVFLDFMRIMSWLAKRLAGDVRSTYQLWANTGERRGEGGVRVSKGSNKGESLEEEN